jgi:hypothetical protein
MLPKFRSFVRLIIRSFVRSFIVPIHRSFIVTIHYSFIRTIQHHYSPLLFDVTVHHRTIHRYHSSTLFTIVTIHRHYSSSLLFIDDIYGNFFVVTIHHYYSSIIRPPQISTTHPSCCPVHLRPARPIFQSYKLR